MIGILSVLAMVAVQDTNFTESFYVGQDVNLSQGFYICNNPNAVGAIEHIAVVRDPAKRRALARRLGCPFRTASVDQVRKVVGITKEVCGPLVRVEGGAMCGTEAHALVVRDPRGYDLTVLFVLDDVIID